MARVQRVPLFDAERDAEIIRRYAARETAQQIADCLGTNQTNVLRELHRLGVKVRSNSESHTKHALRHDAFDVLTPDAAYWCGFLFADGSVYGGTGAPEIGVGVSECDRAHLEKLRAFLGSTHAITTIAPHSYLGYTTRPAVRYAVRSDRLASRLLELGRYEGPIGAGLALSPDFWRGVIDGDGSVGVSCGLPYLRVVGSRRLLEAFVRFLGRVGTRRLHVRPHKTIFCVGTSGATAERVIARLYSDAATALDRKAAAAAGILASVATPEPKPEPRWINGGSRRALINAKGTMCAECMGDVVVTNGRVRLEHEAGCVIGSRLAGRLSALRGALLFPGRHSGESTCCNYPMPGPAAAGDPASRIRSARPKSP